MNNPTADADAPMERNTLLRRLFSSREWTRPMGPTTSHAQQRWTPHTPITSPEDALRHVLNVKERRDPGDSLVLFLDTRQRVIGHLYLAADALHVGRLPIQTIFKAAFVSEASRILVATRHPRCQTGVFVPAEDWLHQAAQLSLAGQLLDLRVIDHLIYNDTDVQSLLLNYQDELYRAALHYSQRQANPLFHAICPN